MKLTGYIGVILIQLAYIPQLYRVITSRSAEGLSPIFIGMVWAGIVLLQVYSYSVGDWVYIVSNWCGIFNTSLLLILIWNL